VCEAVSAEVDPVRVLARTLRCLAEGLDAAPVSLHLLAPEGDALICEAQEDGATAPDRERLPSGRGLTGSVLGGAGLIATAHPDHDPRFEADVDTAADGIARPMLCLPLVFRGRCLGVVRAFLPAGRTPSARSGEVLGAAVSAALRSVLLYRSLVQSIEEVARVRRESRTTP
jgi:sigma-B regulation protein RsbU (phosphoserine phosphatase)